MALIGNYSVLNKSHARFTNGTSTAGAYAGVTRSNMIGPSILRSRDMSMPNTAAYPSGYNAGQALRIARSSGQLASHVQIRNSGTISSADVSQGANVTANLSGIGTISSGNLSLIIALTANLAGVGAISSADLAAIQALAATLSGSGSLTNANMDLLIGLTANLAGVGEVSADFTGLAHMTADITPFTELSPESLANAVWEALLADHATQGTMGYELKQKLKKSDFIALK